MAVDGSVRLVVMIYDGGPNKNQSGGVYEDHILSF